MRDIHSANKQQKDVLLRVTNVMFPMYKAFIEPDLEAAKIRIHSTYNPMAAMVDPIYSCKVLALFAGRLSYIVSDQVHSLSWGVPMCTQAKLSDVEWDHDKFVASLPSIIKDQGGTSVSSRTWTLTFR